MVVLNHIQRLSIICNRKGCISKSEDYVWIEIFCHPGEEVLSMHSHSNLGLKNIGQQLQVQQIM
jgi:hypothetical protein